MTTIQLETTLNKVAIGTTFTINGEQMKELKTMVKSHKKSTLPSLNYIKFEMAQTGNTTYNLVAMYTNTDMVIEKKFESIVKFSNGLKAVGLPIELIKSMKYVKKTEIFTFEIVSETEAVMYRNNVKTSIPTLDLEMYPELDSIRDEQYVELPLKGNKTALSFEDVKQMQQATITTSNSQSRPILSHVLIREGNLISTDSHRMYHGESAFESIVIDVLLHKDFINACYQNYGKHEQMKMFISNHNVKMQGETTNIYYRKLDGNYPSVTRLIPNDFNVTFNIQMMDILKNFLSSLKKEQIVELTVHQNNTITVSNLVNENYPTKTEISMGVIELNTRDNEEFKLHFNAGFMLDAMKQLNDKPLDFKFQSSHKPFIVKPLGCHKELALILPIKLR